jgi:hypothetical protein
VGVTQGGDQLQGNLFGRPALTQKVAHQAEQNAIAMELV